MRPACSAIAAVGLGLVLAATVGGPAAVADDERGEDLVTITVTIDTFDPCAVGAPGCAGTGDLPLTGATVGLPLAAGTLLVAGGAAVCVMALRRRRPAGAG